MPLNTDLYAADRVSAGATKALQANEKGELFTTGGLPSKTEYTRQGKRHAMMSVAAVAALVVRPSTTAALEIHNANAAKSLIITRLFSFNLVSTNVIESFSLWAMVTLAKSAPTAEATALVKRLDGFAYTGQVTGDFSTTVVDNGWYPYGESKTKGAGGVVPHHTVVADIDGGIIVPPGHSLCLHTVASLTAQTFTHGAEWIEEELTLAS